MYGLHFDGSFEAWRGQARAALLAEIPPEDVVWYPSFQDQARDLFASSMESIIPAPRHDRCLVPRGFLEGAELVGYHRREDKWGLLYRLLWRLNHEGSGLLEVQSDPDVIEFYRMQQAVRRDAHKMKAFVRFRKIEREGTDFYVAWHQPDHRLLRYVTPFFKDRFHVMRWTIFTPDESVAWDGSKLHWGPGCEQKAVASHDQLEELWSCYYASIFNPARVKVRAMKAEMAVRYWKSMPETALIPDLLHEAPIRVERMLAQTPQSAAALVPQSRDPKLWEAALGRCQICSFACDRRPFVGQGDHQAPWLFILTVAEEERGISLEAEQWLRARFVELGLPWESLRITAVVKHSKASLIEPRDVAACKPWLAAEIQTQRPEAILCSGLLAGLAILGKVLRWSEVKGRVLVTRAAPRTLVSYDLERLLRSPPGPERDRQELQLRQDLEQLFARSKASLT